MIVLSPEGKVQTSGERVAALARLTDLRGKVIGLLDNIKPNAVKLGVAMHEWPILVISSKARDLAFSATCRAKSATRDWPVHELTRRLAALMLASGDFGRPIIATPGIPPDRVKMLREAFSKALKDPSCSTKPRRGG